MKLFINDGVCKRRWNDNVRIENETSSTLKLSIPNYLESERRQEYIRFIFPNIKERDLEEDYLLKNISLKKIGKNTYHINNLVKPSEHCMYALLRSVERLPDDIFIPAAMKDKVKVLKRMRFIDAEDDYGGFLSNVYLIKIKLDMGESLPVYLASDEAKVLEKHYVFFRSSWNGEYEVSRKLNTYILVNKHKRDEYISLSRL